jgi:hypothetical protein
MVRSRGGHVDAALGRSPAPPHLWNSMSLPEVDLSPAARSVGLDPGRFGGQAIRSSQDRLITCHWPPV